VAARLAPYVTSRGCRLRRSEVARLNQNLKKRVCHSPPYAAEHFHRWNYRRCFADAARKQAGQHMTGPARLPSLCASISLALKESCPSRLRGTL
jgi:hypothetical protein